MGYDNNKRTGKQRHQRRTERIVIGESDAFKRQRLNLLANAEMGFGRAVQRGKHLLYTVGSEQFGYVEYLILNANLPDYAYETKEEKQE